MSVRILLVTGGETWGEEVKPALSQLQFEDGPADVVMAASGWKAIECAERAREPFALAVADLVLPRPGIGGASTLIRIRELCPECRTVLVSDHDGVGDLVCKRFEPFLVRPPSPQAADFVSQLVGIASEFLGENAITQELSPDENAGTTAAVSPSEGSVPDRLIAGKYRVLELLGSGAMGKVYRAEDTFMHRHVALKLRRVESPVDRDQLQRRMRREATITAKLTHPNIVTIYDAGLDGDDVYLVMELVHEQGLEGQTLPDPPENGGAPSLRPIAGQTLRDLLNACGTLPLQKAIGITLQILEALGHAHGKGIIHRDLKPENVLMTTDDTVKVADFGLAKLVSLAAGEEDKAPSILTSKISADGAIIGTREYMAPEQISPQLLDHRVDLFAVGAMLFEMLHGKLLASIWPLEARLACLHSDRPPPDLPQLSGQPKLDRVVQRALAPKREDRYDSSEAFAAALREFQSRSKPS